VDRAFNKKIKKRRPKPNQSKSTSFVLPINRWERFLNLTSNGLNEETRMTEETKITIRQIINQIFEISVDRTQGPAEKRLMSFLMSLNEEQVRKVLTLYFAGRDNEKDIYGQYYDSQRTFPSKECMVYRLLDTKTSVLRDSLVLGLSLVEQLNIDIEKDTHQDEFAV